MLFQPCKVAEERLGSSSSRMLCRMPPLNLASDILHQLNGSEFGIINSTSTDSHAGVATYYTPDDRYRIDIYIGLVLDGLDDYCNISQRRPDISMQFALDPIVSCQSDQSLDFNPKKESVIIIKVGSSM